jgi:hypothetical protein
MKKSPEGILGREKIIFQVLFSVLQMPFCYLLSFLGVFTQENVSTTKSDLIRCLIGGELIVGEVTVVTVALPGFEVFQAHFKLIVCDDCLVWVLGVIHTLFKAGEEDFQKPFHIYAPFRWWAGCPARWWFVLFIC